MIGYTNREFQFSKTHDEYMDKKLETYIVQKW